MPVPSEACVVFTRNMVGTGQEMPALRRVALSAYSLRVSSPYTAIHLATDAEQAPGAAEAWLSTAMRARLGGQHLFDTVSITNESDSALVAELRRFPQSRPARMARSRIMRLQNLRNPPCPFSLFVDDDTYFCPGAPDLGADVRQLLARAPDVRMFMFYKTSKEHSIDKSARACEKGLDRPPSLAEAAACYDAAGALAPAAVCGGAQGGAIAVRKSSRSAAFAEAWLGAYAARSLSFASEADVAAANWLDQSALRQLSLDTCGDATRPWTLGHLPYALNYRGVKKYAFVGVVRLVHQKALFPATNVSLEAHDLHLAAVCRRLNAQSDERRPTIFGELRNLSFAPAELRPASARRRRSRVGHAHHDGG